jgi:cellulose synthase/poly-beta-1,6-N-acetylglucosamine synthase-like glycosyltransferase
MAIAEYLRQYFSWASQISQTAVEWYVNNSRGMVDAMHAVFNDVFIVLLYIGIGLSFVYLGLSALSSWYKDGDPELIADDEAPRLAVHIPTMNELAALECAENCLQSDYPQDKLHIIIGDDSDQPHISEKIQRFADSHDNVTVAARADNVGYKPGNLNNMLGETDAEYITIFDSDFKPDKTFLKRLVTPMVQDSSIHATQGRWEPYNADQNYTTAVGATITDVFDYVALPFVDRFLDTVVLRGSAECVRRSTLKELGEWKSGSFTEDIEFSMRLLKEGYNVEWVPEAKCKCELPFIPVDLYKQQMRWAYGVVTSWIEHGKDFFINLFKLDLRRKPLTGLTMSTVLLLGYVLSTVLFGLLTFGALSFITHPAGPLNLPRFLTETSTNIALTSGLIVITGIAMYRSDRAWLYPRALLAMFTVGIMTTFYVNNGIYRALTGKKMEWFLLSKSGNER